MISITPFRAPSRPAERLHPLAALGHFRKLVADKEDTAQVFDMGECLPSRRYQRLAAVFCRSEKGRGLMASEPYLPELLDDHDQLLAMPEGSVAHAYVAFMQK